MLGEQISDPEGVEAGGTMKGMGLIPMETVLKKEKVRRQVEGTLNQMEGIFSTLSGLPFRGYEIHMGQTVPVGGGVKEPAFVYGNQSNVYGTYIHGIFDLGAVASAVVEILAEKKGIRTRHGVLKDYAAFKESQYEKLADTLSEYLNMEEIYGMLQEARLE